MFGTLNRIQAQYTRIAFYLHASTDVSPNSASFETLFCTQNSSRYRLSLLLAIRDQTTAMGESTRSKKERVPDNSSSVLGTSESGIAECTSSLTGLATMSLTELPIEDHLPITHATNYSSHYTPEEPMRNWKLIAA